MPLTVEQATQAGVLAAEIIGVQGAIANLQGAINANATANEISATVTIGGAGAVMRAAIPMDAAATAALFAQVITAYQAKLDALNAQLAALTA